MACANPLLLEWVGEWLETARERNSKGVSVYNKAYKSLKACPLPFGHPSEVTSLEGFGDGLAKRLTAKMEEYCQANGLPKPVKGKGRKKRAAQANDDTDSDAEAEAPAPKKAKKQKAYVPKLQSGGYGILMALYTLQEGESLLKEQIIPLAQPSCKASYTAPASANGYHTAWNSMKLLVEKELVHERGRPKRYSLLDEGREVARRMREAIGEREDPSPNDSPARPSASRNTIPLPASDIIEIPQGEVITSESSLPSFTPINLPPGSFTVELVLDNREIRAKKDRDYIQNNFIDMCVKPIMKALPVGDILWVAKITNPALKEKLGSDEILLDWVIERKRLDDLISSIKDGRYNDQKFRLQKSGIKNVIYVIESFAMNEDHYQKYDEAVQTAISSMQVINGYFVKQTLKIDDTIRYLVGLTKILKERYEGSSLKVIPTNVITAQNYLPLLSHLGKRDSNTEYHITYPAFASLSSKSDSLTLRDVYLKMLMCTKGITGEKALEIQKRWKTPIEFIEAYKNIEGGGRTAEEVRKRKWELVSTDMANLVGRKKIAKVLSGKISEVWGNESVPED